MDTDVLLNTITFILNAADHSDATPAEIEENARTRARVALALLPDASGQPAIVALMQRHQPSEQTRILMEIDALLHGTIQSTRVARAS